MEVVPGDSVMEKFTNAKNYGFEGISLPGRFLHTYIDELKDYLKDLPLPIYTLSLGFVGSLVSSKAKVRQKCRDSIVKLFEICAEIGAKSLNMPPVLKGDIKHRITQGTETNSASNLQDKLLLDCLPELCDAAKDHDVVILLEPVNRYESDYMNTVGHAAAICNTLQHNSLGVTCDFFHMQLEELKIKDALLAAGKWAKHIHVAENIRCEPGPGSMDFISGFSALKEIGYAGIFEIECRNLSGDAKQVMPASAAYLRKLWASA